MGLQSFMYKICLCMIRRLRSCGDDDGKNPFIAGAISGLSILLIKETYTRGILALYMLIRSCKIAADVGQAKGQIREETITNSILALGLIMGVFFAVMYIFEHTVLQESQWQNLHWLFGLTNQPNDTIFRDILRVKC